MLAGGSIALAMAGGILEAVPTRVLAGVEVALVHAVLALHAVSIAMLGMSAGDSHFPVALAWRAAASPSCVAVAREDELRTLSAAAMGMVIKVWEITQVGVDLVHVIAVAGEEAPGIDVGFVLKLGRRAAVAPGSSLRVVDVGLVPECLVPPLMRKDKGEDGGTFVDGAVVKNDKPAPVRLSPLEGLPKDDRILLARMLHQLIVNALRFGEVPGIVDLPTQGIIHLPEHVLLLWAEVLGFPGNHGASDEEKQENQSTHKQLSCERK